MIPALGASYAADDHYARFLDELRTTGFSGEITQSEADRTVFSTDNSVYQLPPRAVLFPRDVTDITQALRLLAQERYRDIVLVSRGGGTGTNGQSLTTGIILDLSRYMNRILEINVAERWARVEGGVVKD